MANNSMPFVAIIGGIWKLTPAEATHARNTAQEIGGPLQPLGWASLSISQMTRRLNLMWFQAM